jgi:hypothetical protein
MGTFSSVGANQQLAAAVSVEPAITVLEVRLSYCLADFRAKMKTTPLSLALSEFLPRLLARQ